MNIDDAMHPMRSADRVLRHFRQPGAAHVPGSDQINDRTDRIFDRNGGIDPARAIDVDAIIGNGHH